MNKFKSLEFILFDAAFTLDICFHRRMFQLELAILTKLRHSKRSMSRLSNENWSKIYANYHKTRNSGDFLQNSFSKIWFGTLPVENGCIKQCQLRVINRNIKLHQDCLLILGSRLAEWVIRQATLSSLPNPPAGPGGNGGWVCTGCRGCTSCRLYKVRPVLSCRPPTLRLISGLALTAAPPSLPQPRHSRLGTVSDGNSCRIPLTSWDTSHNPWTLPVHPGHLQNALSSPISLRL